MFGKIEHIGIAVSDLKSATKDYTRMLGVEPYRTEIVENEQVTTVFFKTGVNKIELLAPTADSSVVAKFLERRGEGIHHIAFQVDDILAEMERLSAEGYNILNEKPKPGAENMLVCFIHPKEANGVLIELCQES